jgi:hypothetical protein
MNKLTWFIYFADVLPNLPWVFFWTIVGTGVIMFVTVMAAAERQAGEDVDQANQRLNKHIGRCGTFGKIFIIPMLILFVITFALVPTQKTIYLMAGSEVGEEVINTPEVKQVREILKGYLDEVSGRNEKKSENN